MSRTAGIFAGLFAVMAACAAQAQPEPAPQTVKVRIESGVLVGVAHENANAFRNIPFAAPPVGPLRWRPPQPVRAWSGDRQAVFPGVSCPQPMNANDTPNSGGANGPTSEDCLQLNVFAPKHASHAPVMVWIHGGGHRTGAGWIYDGQNFARDGVILVSINYRLGALGYFAHPALVKDARPGEPVGNYGLMDQIAALKWVQRNIAAFGGDPKNVTVFGESAGGMSTLAILATPGARGLYQKAIVESGLGWFKPVTLADQEKTGAAALAKLGVPETASAADLRAILVDKLVPIDADYQPFTDGRLMTETPSQALADGHFDDVPLIIGSNSGEDSLLGPGTLGPRQLAIFAPAMAHGVYKDEVAAGGDQLMARAVFTDAVMGGPARWVAARASVGAPAWLYHFSYIGARFRPAKTRASHADEIQYVFEYWGRRTPMSVVSEEDKQMASLMHACWVAFAKTGAPRCGGQAWPAYTPATDQLMEFGPQSGVVAHFRKAQLDAQEMVQLPGLALGK
ncbi:MAG: carboxylesterase [Phenylobacterium sp.]|nr:MAG: carboxylesterase [Phenylobacterium sp.]